MRIYCSFSHCYSTSYLTHFIPQGVVLKRFAALSSYGWEHIQTSWHYSEKSPHPWQHFNLCQCNFQPFLCSIYPILATAFPLHGYFVLSEVVQEDFVPYTDVIIKYYDTDVVCAPFLLALTARAGRVEPPYWGWCVQHPRFLSSWIVLLYLL